jgi:hypothetical protein
LYPYAEGLSLLMHIRTLPDFEVKVEYALRR